MEMIKAKYQEEFDRFSRQKRENNRLWNIDDEAAALLFLLVRIKRARYIVEVGTSNGYSTMWLSLAARESGGIVHSIEVDEQRYLLAKDNLKEQANIRLHPGKAEDLLAEFRCGIDFLFIDAGKPAYLDYLLLVENKLADGAVITADNICSHPQTTLSFREYVQRSPQYVSSILNMQSGLLVADFIKNIKG
jgi:predicted O-methyltransferase YrrM